MVEFDHLGYDLNRCDSFLDGIQNCIQTCLHHTVWCKQVKNVDLRKMLLVRPLKNEADLKSIRF